MPRWASLAAVSTRLLGNARSYTCHTRLVACICYADAAVAPLTTIFALAYVVLSFLCFKRNLLYSFTHHAESRGAYFPAGSTMLLLILFTAQLLLAAVHISKESYATFVCHLPLFVLTRIANSYGKAVLAPQLETLPLGLRRKHRDHASVVPTPSAIADAQVLSIARRPWMRIA